ncbi:MAG: 16S rRNA (cytidine(1402)-2'-O)-methyltransferase [Pseudomonadales bacterium]|nr:16S rRNA (cytidine(1402)-2'-O)-methyltransferase [Pseudomonadales bacterium]MBO6656285.1 16S rRNA (cytidine(1402)-2'-O)-methyltransferase [Pseudomonadales bacterium]
MSTLYVVATPIGNLEDLTPRARKVLATVKVIAAEDTRRTGMLLAQSGIVASDGNAEFIRLHDHNEQTSTDRILALLQKGQNVAIVSDAGTPLISDPGYQVVRACHEADIAVVPVAGVSSVATALSAAGLPTDRFAFEGFLPAKKTGREARLTSLKNSDVTLIFFEAPHRIQQFIQSVVDIMGQDRELAICRELTKTYEQIVTGSAGALLARLKSDSIPAKGEFVVLVRASESSPEQLDVDALLLALLEELSPSRAAAVAAKVTEYSKSDLYDRALNLKV